jgi:hypothetical protein
MKKIIVSSNRQSREYKSNPHANSDLNSRLKKSNCIHYDENTKIYDLGNGYSRIVPNDKVKKK